ncbi:siphovirus ReqiPepy6 Gp37-like family protein [Kitasatospora sp. NPDC088160]|uniref:siphovirus ReqiPepy6 Gp37-like family protein n=1 Tax=Kitasatospora sp. NPDC088160 TaxID=3364072 RepID=UPI00382B2CEF
MKLSDLTVEVRDRNLARLGLIRPEDLSLELHDVFNNVGTWKLTLPLEHPLATALRAPGAGLIVTGPDDVLMSGPVTRPEYAATPEDQRGSVVFEGVSDTVALADMLAWPEPSNPDASTQKAGHDIRTGPAETIMHDFVNANCGQYAPAPRRKAGLYMGGSQGRGPTITKAARFPVLGDLLTEIATVANLGFRIVQRGDRLVFETYAVTDRSREIRLDVEAGTLAGQRVTVTPPGVTRVLVAGQGDLEARTIVAVDNDASTAAEADWGRRIERFVDQRQTSDPEELRQAGTEALADAGYTGTSVQAIPVADSSMRLGIDWGMGDQVTVVVGGQEMTSTVTGLLIKADEQGFQAGALIGDPTGLNPDAANRQQAQNTELRVSALERKAEAAPAGARMLELGARKQTDHPSTYPEGESCFYLTNTVSTEGGWDFGGKWGFVTTRKWQGNDVRQWWSMVHSPTSPHQEWVRGGNNSGWGPWRRVAFEDKTPRGIVTIKILEDTPHVGDTRTLVYTHTFTAEAKRVYRVGLRIAFVDGDGTGDSSVRQAKQQAVTSVRWDAGTTITADTGKVVGEFNVPVFNDDTQTAASLSTDFYINNAPAGPVTLGVTLRTRLPSASYGKVRFLVGTQSELILADEGGAVF